MKKRRRASGQWIQVLLASLSLAYTHLSTAFPIPQSTPSYLKLRETIGSGFYAEAKLLCEKYIDEYPKTIVFYEALPEICQYDGSISEAVIFLRNRLDGSKNVPLVLYGLGCAYLRMNQAQIANDAFSEAIQEGLRDPKVLKGAVYAYERLHGIDLAIRHFRSLAHHSPDRHDLWYALCLAFWGKGDYTDALDAAKRATILGPRIPQYRNVVSLLEYATGQCSATESELPSLIDSARIQIDVESLGLLRSILVIAQLEKSRLHAARAETNLLLSEMVRFGNLRWLGWSYLRLSEIDFIEANFPSSLRNAKKAAECARRGGDADLELGAINRQFDSFLEIGLFGNAIRNAQSRLLSSRNAPLTLKYFKALADNARAFMEAGEYEVALEYGIRVLTSIEGFTADRELLANIHSTLGQVYLGLGQTEEALVQFQTEEQIISQSPFSLRNSAILKGNQGNCFLANGNLTRALASFREQLSIVKRIGYRREEAYALLNFGDYYSVVMNTEKAKENYLLAYQSGQQMGLAKVVLLASQGMARLSKSVGSESDLFGWLERAINVWGRSNWLSKSGLLGIRGPAPMTDNFEDLLGLLLKGNRKADAFRVADLFNSWNGNLLIHEDRTQTQQVATGWNSGEGGDASNRRAPKHPLANRYRQTSSEDYSDEESKRCVDELADIISTKGFSDEELSVQPDFNISNIEKQDVSLVNEILDDDVTNGRAAMLEYFVGSRNSYGFVVLGRSIECFKIEAGKSDIQKLLKSMGGFIGESRSFSNTSIGKPGFNRRAAETLYRMLIAPVRSILNRTDRLIIVRGRGLEVLPFEMLIEPHFSEAIRDSSSQAFLLNKFEIVYWYGNGIPRHKISRETNGNPFILGMGSNISWQTRPSHGLDAFWPTTDKSNLSVTSIPEVASELAWLKSEFGTSCIVLLNGVSTISALNDYARSSSIIHIAAHSKSPEANSGSGSLVLNGGDENTSPEDLKVSDILNMDFTARLVVLSCCRTARLSEKYSRIDYVKSFLSAGASSVIGSEWDIDDAASFMLMKSFYSHLKEGRRISSALRIAKLELMQSGRNNPYEWAPFILTGDDTPIVIPPDDQIDLSLTQMQVQAGMLLTCALLGFVFVGILRMGAVRRYNGYF